MDFCGRTFQVTGLAFAELDAMIANDVGGYFEPKQWPKRIRLHFSQDPILAVA
jgi:hypothetical protein